MMMGIRAVALRDLRADRVWGGWREADELQAGADGGEVVTWCFTGHGANLTRNKGLYLTTPVKGGRAA
jgi:hypothetical protein